MHQLWSLVIVGQYGTCQLVSSKDRCCSSLLTHLVELSFAIIADIGKADFHLLCGSSNNVQLDV